MKRIVGRYAEYKNEGEVKRYLKHLGLAFAGSVFYEPVEEIDALPEEPPDQTSTSSPRSCPAEPPPQPWIEALFLTTRERTILQCPNAYFNVVIMNAAQTLLRGNAAGIDGLLETAVVAHLHATPLQGPAVQIHHDQQRQHWVTSSRNELGQVFL